MHQDDIKVYSHNFFSTYLISLIKAYGAYWYCQIYFKQNGFSPKLLNTFSVCFYIFWILNSVSLFCDTEFFRFFDFLCAIKVDYSIVDKDSENCSCKIEYKNGDKWDKLIDRSKEVTFVPVRFVADELGAETSWDDATKTVTITKAVAE